MSRKCNQSSNGRLDSFDTPFGKTQAAAELVSLKSIRLPAQQPRRYFDPQTMQKLIASIKQHGLLQPLLVRPLEGNGYELVAGERRYQAALEAGLTEVCVVVRHLNDGEALQLALIENLQREDLNPVEETEGILQLLAIKMDCPVEAIVSLLNSRANAQRGLTDNVVRNQEWLLLEEVFVALGTLSPEAFRTHRLPLLQMPNELLQALRQGRIAYTKARVLARLKDETQRSVLLEEAIKHNLSLSQIQERVKVLLPQPQSPSPKARIETITHLVTKAKLWKNPQKWQRLEALLAEIEALASEE